LGTAIPNLVMCLVVIGQVCRMLEVDLKTLFRQSIRKPALAAAMLVPVWLLVSRLLPPVDRSNFAALIGVGVVVYALMAVALEGSRLRLRRILRSRKRLVNQNWSSQKWEPR